MKRKLFTLLTLLLTVCSGAWADATTTLINQSTGDVNTTDFRCTSTTSTKSGGYTIGGSSYSKYIQLSGAYTTPIGAYEQKKIIQYDAKTNSVTVDVYAFNKASSTDYKLYISMIEEGDEAEKDIDIEEFTITKNSGDKFTHTFTPTTNATIYVHVGNNSNVHICQVEVTDNGATTWKKAGEIGYTANLTLCRLGLDKNNTAFMDGMEFKTSSNNVKVLTSGNPVKLKATDEYISFTLGETEKVSIAASGTYSVTTSNTYQSGSSVSGNQEIVLDAGTYYICPNGSNVSFSRISFLAPPTMYSITYDLGSATGGTAPTETSKLEGATFTVAAVPGDLVAPIGKEFKCWNDGTNDYNPGTSYTVGTNDVVLTAVYQDEVVKYSVTYDLNGGTGTTPTEADKAEDAVFTLHDGVTGITAPAGKRFYEWEDQDGTRFAGGASYTMPGKTVTLTAQWESIFAITELTPENGAISASTTEAAEGEVVTLTATPSEDYLFDSWSVYKTGEPATTITVSDNKFTMPAYAVTINATFIADTRAKVLYVTSDGTVNPGDDLYAALNEDYNVTLIAYNGSATVTNYKLVVLHESIAGSNYNAGLVGAAKSANVPLLNTKSYFYNTDRWNWGTPNAGKSEKMATLNTEYSNIESHPIFAGLTVTSNQIEVVGTAALKAMQPIGSFTSGYEGYTLARTSNESSDQGTAIHELTPAQRGVASAKYLMISVSNAKLNDLSEDGKRLFKNAAAYLIDGSASWTPTVAVSTLSGRNYATCVTTKKLDFAAADGITAYIATGFNGAKNAIVLQSVDVVDAATPIIVKTATQGATVNVPVTTADASSTKDNALVAGDGTTAWDGTDGYTYYYIASDQFHKATKGTLQSGKAYLKVANGDVPSEARAFGFVFEDEGEVTGIHSVSNSVLTTDQVFDLQGRRVAQPTKGLYIMNGRKVIFK